MTAKQKIRLRPAGFRGVPPAGAAGIKPFTWLAAWAWCHGTSARCSSCAHESIRLKWLVWCLAFFTICGGRVPSASGQTIYEAENATLSGPLVDSTYAGYSGTGYVDYQNPTGDNVVFTLTATASGTYPIAFRYANGSTGNRPLALQVNGVVAVSGLDFQPTGAWTTWACTATNNVAFNAGVNTVRITDIGSNGPNVDYLLVTANGTAAPAPDAAAAPLRRPISPNQPMWLVHIDSWNYPDPQKIIDLIPQDIRPYVVMNISLSISHNTSTGQFQVSEYGYEIAKSWLRVCAQNQMWAMIQQSSGGFHHFSDFDLSVYREFYQNYPNFIGFNYAEQFWGFDDPTDALSAKWSDRLAHFANLLKLSHQYGGYLVVSMCWNQWGPNINPIGMLKRNPAFAAACRDYTENYILEEKYTQTGYQSDMESICLGSYLSGYSGQYGIRYDSTGWTDATGTNQNFTLATGGAPHLEHIMLTGETVIDAPELIWQECFQGLGDAATDSGYTMRRWKTFAQFDNVNVDIFRKILDGTVRIPSRQEVINRTKYVIIQDVSSGGNDAIYSSPDTLFQGLYRMDVDGNYANNNYFFKKTGRYPTIPTVYLLDDTLADSFQFKINKSAYSTRWPTITAKTNELNGLFPSEYTGDLYAGRYENAWVVYNPYKTNITASASIPFKYNTCDHVDLTFSRYTSGVMKEYSNRVTFYLCNYQSDLDNSLKTDTITIYGCTNPPAWSYVERGSHQASLLTSNWSGTIFSLTVQHNGPLDLTVNCAGTATGRLTAYTPATLITPSQPMLYSGPRQYEGECFDYQSIAGITSSGYSGSLRNYTGQGYLNFGTSSAAAVRSAVTVPRSGTYRLQTKYAVTGASITTMDLYVNGVKVATPVFTPTATLSDWASNRQNLTLNAGANTLEFKASGTGASAVYFDNIVVAPVAIAGGVVIQENQTGFDHVDGTIDNNYAGYTGDGFASPADSAGAGINWNLAFDSSVTKAFTFRYASTNDSTATLMINGTNVASNIQFLATGSWTNWDYVTVYVYIPAGTAAVRLQSASAGGLPNLDYLELTGGWAGTQPPTGVTALAVAKNQINLSWIASSNASSYNVKRSLTNGGPYRVVAVGITATNFNDLGLTGGTTYYYVVSAVSASVEGSDSVAASATTPSGFIATVGATSGQYTVASGSGVTAGTFDLDDSANVLVVGVYIDASGISCLTNLTTFGGVGPSGYIQTSGAGNRLFALYWLNPKTAAGQTLVIGATASANIGAGYFALQLSGVDTNVPVIRTAAATADAASVNITPTVANSSIVSFYSANDSGLTLTPTAPLTRLGSTLNAINGTGGGGSLAMATNTLAAAGTLNLAWTSSGSTANQGVNGFAFAPVSLPASPGSPEFLTNSYHAGVLSLSWPAGESWRLQMQTNSASVGLGTNWVYVTDGTVSSTNITINPTNGAVFYRLRYP